jgi:uncharacterized coiled-coil protein SlyX
MYLITQPRTLDAGVHMRQQRRIVHMECRQAATLRQIEEYNEGMKNEISITRRATYKAEEDVQKLEKEKSHQDILIDKLQENLKSLHQATALRSAQVSCSSTSSYHMNFI